MKRFVFKLTETLILYIYAVFTFFNPSVLIQWNSTFAGMTQSVYQKPTITKTHLCQYNL